jgi:hypothetical protein
VQEALNALYQGTTLSRAIKDGKKEGFKPLMAALSGTGVCAFSRPNSHAKAKAYCLPPLPPFSAQEGCASDTNPLLADSLHANNSG